MDTGHGLCGFPTSWETKSFILYTSNLSASDRFFSKLPGNPGTRASIPISAKLVGDRFGSLDILINNAGINSASDPNATLRETYQEVFETNVYGVAVMTATFPPLLRASKYHDRHIVNVTSGLGQIGIAYSPTSEYSAKIWGLPVYRSSKSAINMISAVYAVSHEKENILCILAAPGYCRTNFGGGLLCRLLLRVTRRSCLESLLITRIR
ncbi:unnamed protein product [Penicillium discolor]